MGRKQDAKLVAAVQRKKDQAAASSSGNKFSQNQSKFARKQEEQSILESSSTHSKFERARRRSGGVAPEVMPQSQVLHVSQRQKRANKFALNEDDETAKRSRAAYENQEAGSILGISFKSDDEPEDKMPHKQSKHERFEEVISDNRRTRATDKRERDERQQATTDLDAEFSQISHLLQKRDKKAEEYEAFLASGTTEVRNLIAEHKEKQGGKSKKLVIGGDGSTSVSELKKGDEAKPVPVEKQKANNFLDSEDKALLAKITEAGSKIRRDTHEEKAEEEVAPPAAPAASSSNAVVAADEEDDFDKLLGTMRMEMKKAHAVDRTLTEEEQAAEDEKAEKIRHQRSLAERVDTDAHGLTNKELLQRGGEAVHRMDGEALGEYDSEEEDLDYDDIDGVGKKKGDEEGEKKKKQPHPLDTLLGKLETLCKTQLAGKKDNTAITSEEMETKIDALLQEIFDIAKAHPRHTVETFRLFLMEGYRLVAKGKPQTQLNLLIYFICIKIFPLTDNRHPVITPLTILLSNILIQSRLESLYEVKQAMIICSLLVHVLSASNKYSSEPFTFLFNVIGLVAPQNVLEPKSHEATICPFPLMARSRDGILGKHNPSTKQNLPEKAKISIFATDDTKKGQQNPLVLLNVAYTTLLTYANTCSQLAGIPALVDVFAQLNKLVGDYIPAALQETHLACFENLQGIAADAKKFRTPLAMRTFRPAPLRQFDPQLVETMDEDKRELREMKKDMRDERKRVVRHVQAEAAVERRARDKEQTADAQRRETNLKKLMGELQQQQHVMKTVDMFRNKAKSKQKKGLSGQAGNGGGDEGGEE